MNLSLGAQLLTLLRLTLLRLAKETKEAIAYSRERGVVVVTSAGNETAPPCATSPGNRVRCASPRRTATSSTPRTPTSP
ncbi:hypothetical protein [Saccharopolyspora pogona]|uniref:hypothetical protein n=1 Tax=Saccharopolyspora pogona TaxID=333966 RepID=UPI0037CA6B46